MPLCFWEDEVDLTQVNPKKSTVRHLVVKLLKTENKGKKKSLKVERKRILYLEGISNLKDRRFLIRSHGGKEEMA